MVSQEFHHFNADYFGFKNELLVTGRYKKLQGAELDGWQADYTLVVYFRYCSKADITESESERCFYISFSNGKSSVIDIARNDSRYTPFYAWLTELVSNDLKMKQYKTVTSHQIGLFQTA